LTPTVGSRERLVARPIDLIRCWVAGPDAGQHRVAVLDVRSPDRGDVRIDDHAAADLVTQPLSS
jgi:hypothetical protein